MITILCSGSRGDVQPYIALAMELEKLGLAARIATGRNFEGFVRGYGTGFHAINADIESAGVDPRTIAEARKADTVLKMFFSFRRLREYGMHMVEQMHDACLGSDAIVYHPGLAVGRFAADRLGIPSILASPFPLHRTAERPSVLLYGRAKPNPVVNRMSHRMLQGMLWMASGTSLRSFWKRRYGSLPESFGMPFERHGDPRHPAIVSCSDHVFPRPEDWDPHVHQGGFWFVEEPGEYRPEPGLADFLARGEPPVYVGFGSMIDRDDASGLVRVVVDALVRTGTRGILSGMGGMEGAGDLPDSVFAVGNVPHSWLFPRMAAVCHHGGAGTSAAGFRAGVPGIIVPFALDQFAWAWRASELGVSPEPLPFRKLRADRLAGAILAAKDPGMRERAAALGRAIAPERGARDCARVIARALEARCPQDAGHGACDTGHGARGT